MNFYSFPGLYTLLYVSFYFICRKYGKNAQIGRILILIYAAASASSIYYYYNGCYFGERLRLDPYLYLFITTSICIFPFLNTKKLDSIPFRFASRFEATLDSISIILGVFSCWWLFELVYIGAGGITELNFSENYGDNDFVGAQMSWLGRKFKLVSLYSLNIVYFLFFYQLAKKRNRFIIILLAFGTLASPLDALIGGHRFVMVFSLIRYLVFFLLFQQALDAQIKIILKAVGIFIVGVMAFGLFLITASRFEDIKQGIDLTTWITLYTGEGPLRFNLQAWDMPIHTEGDNTITVIKDFLGMNPACGMTEKATVWGSRHHLQYGVYYTFIGDVFFDFGRFGTILFVLLFALLTKYLLNNYKGKPGSILIIGMLLQFVMFGFTYNPYILYTSQVELIITILFSLWLNYRSKPAIR